MFAYCILSIVDTNVVVMALKSVHKPSFRLAHILQFTCSTGYAVNQIAALTIDPWLCVIASFCLSAHYLARGIQIRAISAIAGFAGVGVCYGSLLLIAFWWVFQFCIYQDVFKIFVSSVSKDHLFVMKEFGVIGPGEEVPIFLDYFLKSTPFRLVSGDCK